MTTDAPPPSPKVPALPEHLSDKIARNALAFGSLALLPIPLLDSWLQGRVQRELYRGLGLRAEKPLSDACLDTLIEFRGSYMLGCLVGVVWWPIKKLLRKIVYVFAMKDAVDGVAESAVRAEMVRRAIDAGRLPNDAGRVRTAMDASWRTARSPLWDPSGGHAHVETMAGRALATRVTAALVRRSKGAAVLAAFEAELAKPDPAVVHTDGSGNEV